MAFATRASINPAPKILETAERSAFADKRFEQNALIVWWLEQTLRLGIIYRYHVPPARH
ncbi:MAG: hypothetical protein V3V02_06090 [Rhizobiaceae bacterium]